MKNRLQYALCELDAMERTAHGRSPLHSLDARAKLTATVVYLAAMLSVPLSQLSDLLLYLAFPLLAAAMGRLDYGRIFRRSLAVLPFVVFIGVFDLFCDREPAFRIGALTITAGWVRFLSIILRGLLSVQALLILLSCTGCYRLCRGMQRMGLPAVFTSQLLFVYRYLHVLLEESLALSRARHARSFGRRSYPLDVWGAMIGQLLVRTFDRAEQISRAMLARGFTGRLPPTGGDRTPWTLRDTLFLASWSTVLIAIRLFPPAERLADLIRSFR